MPTFRERLEEYRIDMNLQKQQLAILLGIQASGYTNYLSGERTPELQTCVPAARNLCVTLDWFTGEVDSPKWFRGVDLLRLELNAKAPTLEAVDVMDRLIKVIYLCQELAPFCRGEERVWFMAGVLGLTVKGYNRLLSEQQVNMDHCLPRFANFTGLDRRWFMLGDLKLLAKPDMSHYYAVNIAAERLGISPADLQTMLPTVKGILDQMKISRT